MFTIRVPLLRAVAGLVATVAVLLPHSRLSAQPSSGKAAAAPSANGAGGTARKVLNLEDYGRWNRINAASISNDGKWTTFTYTPNDGEPTLHVKSLDGDKVYSMSLGTAGGGAGRAGGGGGRGGGGGNAPQFSNDSRWITYFVNPPDRTAGRGGRGGGAPPAAGRGTTPAAVTPGHLELLNVATGEKTSIANASSWKFSANSKWLATRLNKAQADAKHNGADLIVRDLATGTNRLVGSANQFEFDDSGKMLAYTVDAAERLGNGVYLLDPATGDTRQLDALSADYDQLTWSTTGGRLAVLRGDKVKDMKQKSNALLTWSGFGTGNVKALAFDPAKATSFPKGMVLSEYTAPRFSKDGSRVFVGIKEQEPEIPAADSTKANVDVWHWKDAMPQSQQIVQLTQLRRATIPAVYLLETGAFVRLGNDSMRTVTMAANSSVGVGRDDFAYRGEVAWGGSRADLYKVDAASGARTLIDKGLSRTYGTSPNSRWFLYLKDKQVRAFNLENANSVVLDASSIPGRSYVNEDDDHAYEKPIWGVGGWSKDGKSVLLYDKFDVWQVPLDGGKATNLTQGVGRAQAVQFRVVRLDAPAGGGGRGGGGGFGGAGTADDDGVDLSQPVMLSAYGDRTKKSGYWKVTAGQAPTPSIWADKNIGGVTKADSADRILYTQQDFAEFPDYWVSTTAFASPRKVTDANPILAEYTWASKKVLIDYTTSKGKKLQGTLMLPPDYQPGKKYPMLVEFYEIMSNTHNNFSTPGYSNSPQLSTYASNGYLVFQPDMVYEIGKPGSSALDCMTSAVKKVIELGYADPKRIGLHGHSWSGYQSSYIVTQTNMFAAVVTGAPPTNLISFYDELYKSSGTVQQGITTVGQVRMGANVTPWNAHDLYEDQSPIFHVRKINTPLMILQGMEDGAVDYVEGLQFFNAARQNGKQVILLSYPGEAHNLTNRDNQKYFTIRMKQFFDHYLMDKPAPKWMTDGLGQVNKGGTAR
ncbi:MAG: S9 family peptidase [Gemmatimonadaceae bacterium]|nr:S9 family peptidase [Gemmatimonadaceae bacterium]